MSSRMTALFLYLIQQPSSSFPKTHASLLVSAVAEPAQDVADLRPGLEPRHRVLNSRYAAVVAAAAAVVG